MPPAFRMADDTAPAHNILWFLYITTNNLV